MHKVSNRRLGAAVGTICGSAALLLGFAATADAASFEGRTTQGQTVTLTVDKDGVPSKFAYAWDMRCKGGGTLEDGSTLSSSFDDADVDGFESSGSYTSEVERKFEAQVKVTLEGQRRSDTRFIGNFKIKARVVNEKTGEVEARCGTGLVRWAANLKGPASETPAPTPQFRAG